MKGSGSKKKKILHPTTDDIFKSCSRFRILVIGKTGVGKSSLINHAFGVQEALVSNDKPGEANIETEFISPQNDRFVLHDSNGLERKINVKTVREFIQRKTDMPALKDKLHAVWLCLEIPRAGELLLGTGTEDFLKSNRDGELRDIPIVVVLTEYDMLIDRVDRTLDESTRVKLSDDEIKRYIKDKADAELQETCIKPLERFAGSTIPWIVVSKKEKHKNMIAHLIQITEERVRKHVAIEASMMAGVAQRVDPMLNIKTSIRVGKRRYWKALVSTAAFKGQTVQACQEVLHTNIICVWNFQDPHHYLESMEFKQLVANLVSQLDIGSILLPLLRHFIAYIVDLTIVLQMLYLVSDNKAVTRWMIKLAVAACYRSLKIADIHDRIGKCDVSLPLLNKQNQKMLAMIEELTIMFRIRASEIPGLRARLLVSSSQPDEPWT